MIEVIAVKPLRAEVVTGALLAVSIIAAIPRNRSDLLPADQLALCLLLGACSNMGATKIAARLNLPVVTTLGLIARAVEAGRVTTEKSGRNSIVTLTAKAKEERKRARGAARLGL